MNENLEHLKQKADQLAANHRWDELIPVCTEIIDLEQKPHEKARAYVQRGIAYDKTGEHHLSIEDCTKALDLNPAYINAYIQRGIAYINKDKHDKAIENFTKILDELDPDDAAAAKAYHLRGFVFSLKGDHNTAIVDFTKALELNHNYADAYFCRGFAYIDESENFLDAFKDFVKANKCNPVLKVEVSEIYVADKIANIYKERAEEEGAKVFELYFRLLEAISEIQEKQFYASRENTEVAHYTCLHTLKGLAAEGRFRLYNADYMNDPEEGRVFFEIMKKFGIEDVEKVFYGDKNPSYPSPAYIGSFVKMDAKDPKQKDELFLWRTYGKHDGQEAAGACLIFKHEGTVFAEKLNAQIGAMPQLQFQLKTKLRMSAGDSTNLGERQPPKPELYEIVYSDEELNQEFSLSPLMQLRMRSSSDKWHKHELCEKLKRLAESLKQIKEHIEEVKDSENKEKLRKLVRELLDAIRFLFKARHYKEEKEVRVVQVRYYDGENVTHDKDSIQVDTEKIPPRFYLETHENFRFSEAILGPRARGEAEWKRWLKEQDETLSVKKSEINYGERYH